MAGTGVKRPRRHPPSRPVNPVRARHVEEVCPPRTCVLLAATAAVMAACSGAGATTPVRLRRRGMTRRRALVGLAANLEPSRQRGCRSRHTSVWDSARICSRAGRAPHSPPRPTLTDGGVVGGRVWVGRMPHPPPAAGLRLGRSPPSVASWAPDADFREGQLAAIEALLVQRARVLVVQRTGWGKSAVYFVSTVLTRAAGRADGHRLAAARAHARPDRRGRACRGAGGHDELGQRDRLGTGAIGPERRRGGRPADQPGAAQQPALPRGTVARSRPALRAARRRRGPLHQRLGARFPAGTTGASGTC